MTLRWWSVVSSTRCIPSTPMYVFDTCDEILFFLSSRLIIVQTTELGHTHGMLGYSSFQEADIHASHVSNLELVEGRGFARCEDAVEI
jgi:hypothetical protein